MNATTQAIVDRLPRKPLLAPRDIAAACGLATAYVILADIAAGKIAAAKIGAHFIVSREEAIRYISARATRKDQP